MLTQGELIAKRYRILTQLGRGGMGIVYLAQDETANDPVAVKLLALPPGESQLRFRREFRVMSRLSHPNIIRIRDSGVHDELPYLIMNHLSGGTLLERYPGGASNRADLNVRLELMAQTADALAYIHTESIIHRDLKPENIMLESPENPIAKLMDFGLAKRHTQETMALTQVGAIMGTAAYMSPEQAKGAPVDARSDLYAFGCLLYWIITGEPPFKGKNFPEIIIKQLRERPLPPSQHRSFLPPRLDDIVLRLLEKVPADRYSTTADVAAALRDVILEETINGYALPLGAQDLEELAARTLEAQSISPGQLLQAPLIGRDDVWEGLERALQALARKQGKVVILEGTTGMGVSRLLRELRQEARALDYPVLSLAAHEGVHVPYYALREGLERLQTSMPERFKAASEGLEEALAPLLPQLAPGKENDLPADIARLRLYDAVATLLSRLAQPLVILVDKLHLSDEGTVGLLAYLARAQTQENLMVLGLDEAQASRSTRDTLRSLEAEKRVLEPLSSDNMRQLFEALLGAELDTQLETHLLERAAGNPFFTQEILAALLKAGQIKRRAGVWEWNREAISIPASIEGIFMQRLEGLSERAQKTLSVASAIGRAFPFELLLGLLESDEDSLLDDLDDLLRAGLVEDIGKDHYRFTHLLLREALHERLQSRRRRRYHEKLAQTLEADPATPPGTLAEHYAETSDAPKAAPYALAAARHAESIFANDVAQRYYCLALEVLPKDAPERAQVMLELGGIYDRIGRWEEAAQHYREVSQDASLRAEALCCLGVLAQKQGDLNLSEELLRQTVHLNPHDPKTYSNLGRTLTLKSDLAAARKVLQQALALALEQPDTVRNKAITQAQIDLAELEYHSGNWQAVHDWLQEALERAEAEGLYYLQAKADNLLASAYWIMGKLEKAERHYELARAAYHKFGDVERELSALSNLSNVAFTTANPAKAAALDQEVYSKAQRIGDKKHQAIAATNQAAYLLDLGEYKKASGFFEEARALFSELGQVHNEVTVRLNLAILNTRVEKLEAAQAEIEAAQSLLTHAPQPYFEALLKLRHGEVALRAKQLDSAQILLEVALAEFNTLQHKGDMLAARLLLAELYIVIGESALCQTHLAKAQVLATELNSPTSGLKIAYLRAFNEQDAAELEELTLEFSELKLEHELTVIQRSLLAQRDKR